MTSPKQLGAKQMFDQSLVYLYNSFREEGLSVTEARQMVVREIEAAFEKYKVNNVTPMRDFGISDPLKLIDEINTLIDKMETSQSSIITSKSLLKRKLFHLKKVLGG